MDEGLVGRVTGDCEVTLLPRHLSRGGEAPGRFAHRNSLLSLSRRSTRVRPKRSRCWLLGDQPGATNLEAVERGCAAGVEPHLVGG